jgi:hypothetical protein
VLRRQGTAGVGDRGDWSRIEVGAKRTLVGSVQAGLGNGEIHGAQLSVRIFEMNGIWAADRTIAQRMADVAVGAIALAAIVTIIVSNESFSITETNFRDANPCPSIENVWKARDATLPCPGYVIVPARPKNHREWNFKWEPVNKH